MSNWIDFLVDCKKIKSIFGDSVVGLVDVSIHEITMHRDGPSIQIRFDTGSYPAHPPKKWVDRGFNKVQITLACVDVSNFRLSGISTAMEADLNFQKLTNEITLAIHTQSLNLELKCKFLMVESISAYFEPKDL